MKWPGKKRKQAPEKGTPEKPTPTDDESRLFRARAPYPESETPKLDQEEMLEEIRTRLAKNPDNVAKFFRSWFAAEKKRYSGEKDP